MAVANGAAVTSALQDMVVLDGSMGRLLLNMGLPSDGQLWSARALVDAEYHKMVVDAHARYIAAGANAITTNNYAVQPSYYRKAFGEELWEEKLMEHTRLSVRLARQAIAGSGRPEVKLLGCLPPLVESHRPDLTEDAYLEQGQAFFERVYGLIAQVMVGGGADLLLAETMSTEQEMLCAVRAAAAVGKPVIVSMAAGLRARDLQPQPWRAAVVAEFVLQEVQQKRAEVPALCFNCGSPEQCTEALANIPAGLRRRLRETNIALGVYANINRNSVQRQARGFDATKQGEGQRESKIPRREDMTNDRLRGFCDEWTGLSATYIGGCCGCTPEDIEVIAAHLKRKPSA